MSVSRKPRIIAMAVLILVSAAVCVAVLFNVQLYAVYAIWKTPRITSVRETLYAVRGNIYDRNGVLLAGTDENGKRYYPENTAVHILGALNSSGEPQGGAELAFNSYLLPQEGYAELEYTTLKGVTYLSNENIVPAQNGRDIYLTIDSRVQLKAEELLKNAMNEYQNGVSYGDWAPPSGSGGAITVLDTETGEVLAMASAPDFELADFSENYDEIIKNDNSPLLNRASQGLYRPGSTLKTCTAIAALSEGVISPYSYFFCKGSYDLSEMEFSCMNEHRFVTVKKALEVSCNIFFYKTSQLLGIDDLVSYEKGFGLGESPDFALPAYGGRLASPELFESMGEVWTEGQLLQAAIGQSETACTPLQMALMAEQIANKGVRYAPNIVLKISDGNSDDVYKPGTRISAAAQDKNKAYEICTEGMTESTKYTYGQYSLSQLDESAAIKTGTPQSPRGYDSAVIGFYPANDPKIAFSVMLEGGANAKNTVGFLITAAMDRETQY